MDDYDYELEDEIKRLENILTRKTNLYNKTLDENIRKELRHLHAQLQKLKVDN